MVGYGGAGLALGPSGASGPLTARPAARCLGPSGGLTPPVSQATNGMQAGQAVPARPLIAAVRLRPHGCCLPAAPRLRPAPHAPTVGVVGADAPPPGLTARRLPHLRGTLPALPVGLRPVGRPGGGPPSAPPALWGLSARLPPGLPPARLRARGPRPAAGAYGPLGRQCRRAGRRACAPISAQARASQVGAGALGPGRRCRASTASSAGGGHDLRHAQPLPGVSLAPHRMGGTP